MDKATQIQTALETMKKVLFRLHPLNDEVWEELKSYFRPRSFKKGEHFLRAGDTATQMYFIAEGLVRLYYTHPDGMELNKSFYCEDNVVTSYTSLLTKTPSNLSIQALENTLVLAADYAQVRRLNDTDLDLQICARKIAEIEFVSKDTREQQFLMLDAKERYRAFKESHRNMIDRLPLVHIASYLGIRPETLSRIKSE